jgi:hypothetical protein
MTDGNAPLNLEYLIMVYYFGSIPLFYNKEQLEIARREKYNEKMTLYNSGCRRCSICIRGI